MKSIIKFMVIFIISILLCDLILSFFLEKEIYKMIHNKLDIIPVNISEKQPEWANFFLKWNEIEIPYWENNEYRGPYLNYKKNKKLNCRVLWIWDSIIWWTWINWSDTYFNLLSKKIKNTEWINNWVPWHDTLQSIIKYKEWKIYEDTDLLIWHFWSDDDKVYKLINWTLYNSQIITNTIWEPYLLQWDFINGILLKYSYLYNKLLKIKMKSEIKLYDYNNVDYIVSELNKNYIDYLSISKNKKILILFSPSLTNNSYKEKWWKNQWYPEIYKKIDKNFSWVKNINILYLDSLLKWIYAKDIRYDECCHFNKKWHKIIAEKLYDYIKNKKLLNEKCY